MIIRAATNLKKIQAEVVADWWKNVEEFVSWAASRPAAGDANAVENKQLLGGGHSQVASIEGR